MTLKATRHRDGNLELPTVTLLSPRGARVDFIGMIHLAPQRAWEEVIDLIKARTDDGALVLREGVGRLSDEELDSLSAPQRRATESLTRVASISKHVASSIGLVHQGDVDLFAADAEVKSGDVSVLEMARAHPLGVWPWLPVLLTRLEAALETEAFRESLKKAVLERSGFKAPKVPARFALWLTTGLQGSVILESRDDALVANVLEHSSRDLVLPWGAAHLPGVVGQLLAYGYHFEALTWRSVVTPEDVA
jgi:hypothetical protein